MLTVAPWYRIIYLQKFLYTFFMQGKTYPVKTCYIFTTFTPGLFSGIIKIYFLSFLNNEVAQEVKIFHETQGPESMA